MCATKGCWVVEPWETRVRRAERRRTGGTVLRREMAVLSIVFLLVQDYCWNSRLEIRTSSIMFLRMSFQKLISGLEHYGEGRTYT